MVFSIFKLGGGNERNTFILQKLLEKTENARNF